jgi:hypothetical protein
MPKRLKLEPHQTPSELSKLYRQASDPIERTRYQIIWLLATGRVTEDVAEVTGYCRNSIYRLVRRYNQLGANGLKDKRHQHPGTQPLLLCCGTSTTVANFTNSHLLMEDYGTVVKLLSG